MAKLIFFFEKRAQNKNDNNFFCSKDYYARARVFQSISSYIDIIFTLSINLPIINLLFQIFRLSFLVSLSPSFSARVRATLQPFLASRTLLTHHNSHRILFFTHIESVKLFVLPLNLYRTEPRVRISSA